MTDPNAPQAAFWEELAPNWLEGEQHSEKVSGPFGHQTIARLAPTPGQRVLDIGCGSGRTTVELAHLVAPGGDAVGADIAPTLVEAARARAEAAGATNARFVLADAQRDDLGEGVFDAAFSRFGVMFFADPGVAFQRIHRSLRPEGTLAFCCWQDLFANEWMFIPGSAVITATGTMPPMPGPGEPGPFSFSEPDHVEAVLAGAGFTDIEVEPMATTIVLPHQDVASLTELSQRVGPVREALLTADEDTRQRILTATREALEAKVTDGELRLTAAAFVVRAGA